MNDLPAHHSPDPRTPLSSEQSTGEDSVAQLKLRIENLENLITHLQRDQESLSESLISQHKTIDQLYRLIQKLDVRIDQALQEPEVRDPNAERPPHY